jgi:hypothetical protein
MKTTKFLVWAIVIAATVLVVAMCTHQSASVPPASVPPRSIEQQQADDCHWATVEYNKNPTQANWDREVQKCDKP